MFKKTDGVEWKLIGGSQEYRHRGQREIEKDVPEALLAEDSCRARVNLGSLHEMSPGSQSSNMFQVLGSEAQGFATHPRSN